MKLIKNSTCIGEKVDDGMILFNEITKDTIMLNEVATFLYENCNNITQEDCIDKLLAELIGDYDTVIVKKECLQCLEHMREKNIIVEVENE